MDDVVVAAVAVVAVVAVVVVAVVVSVVVVVAAVVVVSWFRGVPTKQQSEKARCRWVAKSC